MIKIASESAVNERPADLDATMHARWEPIDGQLLFCPANTRVLVRKVKNRAKNNKDLAKSGGGRVVKCAGVFLCSRVT